MSETAAVKADYGEALFELTLCRPPVNVLRKVEMDALSAALTGLDADRARFVVLRAEGPHFCAGADVGEHLPEAAAALLASFHGLVRRLLELPVPTFALVQGRALGAGCELALACDFVIAEEGSSFGLPEIRLGVYPPVALVLLPRLIGPQRARQLILTGASIDATTAYDWSLVSEVVTEGGLGAGLEARIQQLQRLSGSALAQAKAARWEIEGPAFAAELQQVERRYLDRLMATHDANEGLRAFLDKREPVWLHR